MFPLWLPSLKHNMKQTFCRTGFLRHPADPYSAQVMDVRNIPLSDVWHYLRAPRYLARRQRLDPVSLRHIVQLLFLTLSLILVMSGIIGGLISSVEGELPDNAVDALARTSPAMFLFIGIMVAPIWEEIAFRSWLGGPRACLLGLPLLAGVAALLAGANAGLDQVVTMGMAAGLAVMVLALSRQYNSRSPQAQDESRSVLFPAAFYGSVIIFGLMHLSNYDGGISSWVMVLTILPQILVGMVLGYVRMRFGLIAAILFHAAYNATFIGLIFVTQSLAVPSGTTDTALIGATRLLALVGDGLPA